MSSTELLLEYGRKLTMSSGDFFNRKQFKSLENQGQIDRAYLQGQLDKAGIRPSVDNRFYLLVGTRELKLTMAKEL